MREFQVGDIVRISKNAPDWDLASYDRRARDEKIECEVIGIGNHDVWNVLIIIPDIRNHSGMKSEYLRLVRRE